MAAPRAFVKRPAILAAGIGAIVTVLFVLVVRRLASVGVKRPGDTIEEHAYNALQSLAITNLQALVDGGLAISSGFVALFGAAVLGFHDRLKLSPAEAIAASFALFFCVVSSLAGTFVKIKIAQMMARELYYVLDPIIGVPLTVQLFAIVAALGALSCVLALRLVSNVASLAGERS
jgi:hypothetical protein